MKSKIIKLEIIMYVILIYKIYEIFVQSDIDKAYKWGARKYTYLKAHFLWWLNGLIINVLISKGLFNSGFDFRMWINQKINGFNFLKVFNSILERKQNILSILFGALNAKLKSKNWIKKK